MKQNKQEKLTDLPGQFPGGWDERSTEEALRQMRTRRSHPVLRWVAIAVAAVMIVGVMFTASIMGNIAWKRSHPEEISTVGPGAQLPADEPAMQYSSEGTEGLAYTAVNQGTAWSVSVGAAVKESEIVIPATFQGLPVVEIGESAFFDDWRLKKIVIPDSVTRIGRLAFERCFSLTEIALPDSITHIERYAFVRCGLTGITVPAGVMSIGEGVFADCSNLAGITVEKENPYYHSDGNCLIQTAEKKLVAGCQNSVIPTDGSVTSIGTDAFGGCKNLESISIPDCVTILEEGAFSGCSGLKSVVGLAGVTSIGNSAFRTCSNLTEISIPDSVTYIGEYAFCSCSSLTGFSVPEGVTSIELAAFSGCSGLTEFIIPDGVTSVGPLAFAGCTKLRNIVLPSGIDRIEEGAFAECGSLESITVPAGVKSIGAKAFERCTGLQQIELPEGTISIADSAFVECNRMVSITVPASVKTIGSIAFYNCSKLESIFFRGTVAQWKEIKKDPDWDQNSAKYTVRCTDGEVRKASS